MVTREARRLVGSARFMLRERGARFLRGDAVDLGVSYASYPFVARKRAERTFTVGDRAYRYATDHYNRAWRNERAVELALGRAFLDEQHGNVGCSRSATCSRTTATTEPRRARQVRGLAGRVERGHRRLRAGRALRRDSFDLDARARRLGRAAA